MWDSLGRHCGVDIPWAAYRDALGEAVEPQHEYRTGVLWVDLQRDVRAFLDYRRHGQLSCAGWLRSLQGEKAWAHFDRHDWRPTLVAAAEQVRAVRELVPEQEALGTLASERGLGASSSGAMCPMGATC